MGFPFKKVALKSHKGKRKILKSGKVLGERRGSVSILFCFVFF